MYTSQRGGKIIASQIRQIQSIKLPIFLAFHFLVSPLHDCHSLFEKPGVGGVVSADLLAVFERFLVSHFIALAFNNYHVDSCLFLFVSCLVGFLCEFPARGELDSRKIRCRMYGTQIFLSEFGLCVSGMKPHALRYFYHQHQSFRIGKIRRVLAIPSIQLVFQF